MVIPPLKPLILKTAQNWQKDNAPRLSAALSFYAMLALSPILVLAVAVLGRVLGNSEAGRHIVHLAEGYLGKQGDTFLESLIASSAKPGASVIASILSVALAVYGATNLF